MKHLTALLCILMIAALTYLPSPVYAAPTSSYARAIVEDAYFFTEKDTTTSLFAVPYTYCVEILRDEGDWYYVRYAQNTGVYKAVEGYCRKQDFALESGVPQVTYLYKTVTVKYSVKNGNSSLPVLSEIALEAAYYGTYYAGATVYSYVYCQGSFGYIEGAFKDYDLNLPKEETPVSGSNATESTEQKSVEVNIGIIIFAAILAVATAVILIIHFTTKRPKSDG